jgi:hypothetical protein
MRFFELLNILHVFMYLLPGLLFIIILGLLLGYSHFRSEDAEESKSRIIKRFPEGLQDRGAPFPLGMTLIIVGTVLWSIFYILGIGIYKVVI